MHILPIIVISSIAISISNVIAQLESDTCNNIQTTSTDTSISNEVWKIHTDSQTEYIYEIPKYDNMSELKGIILFAHGCGHSATDWWSKSPSCPLCIGLPEERKLIQYFIRNKFVVMAISSQNRESKCWSFNNDIPKIYEILLKFKSTNNFQKLPIFAFGASAGGAFVGHMALDKKFVNSNFNLKGVVVQVSALPLSTNDENSYDILNVPILFIPMEKHEYGLITNQKQMDKINEKNSYLFAEMTTLKPLRIDPLFFYNQIKNYNKYDKQISKEIYDVLKNNGYLDDENYLIKDVTHNKTWRSMMEDIANKLDDSLIHNTSPIVQELQVAWGLHSLSSEPKETMLQFFSKCLSTSNTRF
eukprot:259249_1